MHYSGRQIKSDHEVGKSGTYSVPTKGGEPYASQRATTRRRPTSGQMGDMPLPSKESPAVHNAVQISKWPESGQIGYISRGAHGVPYAS